MREAGRNPGRKEKNMKKYIVVEAKADEFQDVFDTLDEANKFALDSWNHLTNSEKRGTHIYVCFVTEKDLSEDAIDEETGEIDWICFGSCDMTPDCFDSEEYEKQLAREEEERFQEEQRKWAEWEKSLDGEENGK